ncbi:hypothetical protein O6H91_09G108600 [Diphasiastrum complanatum]|uniref:Uncharacterized protein n=1 Tax=Diphasiastrum complanatum TaxID=34168 RepID=A0ACC2CU13_DIPCM|nr:hypothetical protein O6H91_09G108600 [Diphasiastrum complanatum]
MKLYPKLAQKHYGPFKTKKVINEVTCELDLPLTWKIHDKFHISLLKKFHGSIPEGLTDSEPPEVQGTEEILQPEQILMHKTRAGRNGLTSTLYLLKFKNYPTTNARWMEEEFFQEYPEILNCYMRNVR